MKARLVKKYAKASMAGVWEYPVTVNYHLTFDGDGVYKAEYVLPVRDLREVGKLAGRHGWDGCHWDAPALLGFVDESRELCPPIGGWGTEKLSIAAKVFKREGLL